MKKFVTTVSVQQKPLFLIYENVTLSYENWRSWRLASKGKESFCRLRKGLLWRHENHANQFLCLILLVSSTLGMCLSTWIRVENGSWNLGFMLAQSINIHGGRSGGGKNQSVGKVYIGKFWVFCFEMDEINMKCTY